MRLRRVQGLEELIDLAAQFLGMRRNFLRRLQHLTGGVREIQGAVVQLAAHRDLNDEDPDRKTIVKVLQGVMSGPRLAKRISIDEIIEEVSTFYQVRIQDLLSSRRTKILADPRHIAIYIARRVTGLTLAEIGARFGGRDHSTILHAVNKVKGICIDDLRKKNEIDGIMAQLSLPVTV